MAWAARKVRIHYERDDVGAPFGFVYSPVPPEEPAEDYEDAMDHAERFYRLRPKWHCDDCGHPNSGGSDVCAYCGHVRDDIECG